MGNYNSGFVGVRCSEQVLNLVDEVGELYGLTRAEIMRNGAISYCQQLLVTDTLQRLNQTCRDIGKKLDTEITDLKTLDELESLVDLLHKRLGIE